MGFCSMIKKLSEGKIFLKVSNAEFIIERGEGWDSFGVRDPALLVDEDGFIYKNNGKFFLYYTGSSNGYVQKIGLSISEDGKTWRKLINPVLQHSNGICSTPWVIRCKDGLFRMYYREGKGVYIDEGLGIAVSEDGINFQRKKILISVYDIPEIYRCRTKFMGVMNFAKTLDGKNLVLFEAASKSFGERTQIFAVVSDDYENFKPFNRGYPIFTRDHVSSWFVDRVANPRLYTFPEAGLYMLVFNGSPFHTTRYSIGIAFSKDLTNWWEYKFNPILIPSEPAGNHHFSGRIEGGVFIKDEIVKQKEKLHLYFMSIPADARSHERGVIAMAEIKLANPPQEKISFSSFSEDDVSAENGKVYIRSNTDYFPRVILKNQSYITLIEKSIIEITLHQGNDIFRTKKSLFFLDGKEFGIINTFLKVFSKVLLKLKRVNLLPLLYSAIYSIISFFPRKRKERRLNLSEIFTDRYHDDLISIKVIKGKISLVFKKHF